MSKGRSVSVRRLPEGVSRLRVVTELLRESAEETTICGVTKSPGRVSWVNVKLSVSCGRGRSRDAGLGLANDVPEVFTSSITERIVELI